jgi:ABC-type amino acid transport substrate-binding protein
MTWSDRRATVALRLLPVLLLSGLLSGCGLDVPTDPDGTLERVRSEGTLRVGASPRPGWVELTGGADPRGREPDLVTAFADELGAEVEWTIGGEEHLVGLLEDGELDLAVGGFTDANLWMDRVGLTRPYTEVEADGRTESHVMMVPMGENALMSELERWLDEHGGPP